jgi:hypothetical protein
MRATCARPSEFPRQAGFSRSASHFAMTFGSLGPSEGHGRVHSLTLGKVFWKGHPSHNRVLWGFVVWPGTPIPERVRFAPCDKIIVVANT